VTDQAENIEQAVNGAADKLEKRLDHELGRLRDK
jgi:ribosome-associated translation inhibitor RaiA